MPERLSATRLIVLYGGRSAEHEVSCVSALHVLRAADPDRYDLVPVGIDREGQWFTGDDALEAVRAVDPPAALTISGTPIEPGDVLGDRARREHTVVFPLLHGPHGEDGTLQGLLEVADVAYVGTGVLGSALAMDKSMARAVVASSGIPQCKWLTFTALDGRDAIAKEVEGAFGYPVFTKPASLGSSVGISKVTSRSGLDDALDVAFSYDERIVIEEGVTAREIEVAVLGNAIDDVSPRASLPGEVVGGGFYDYTGKYLDNTSTLQVPAELSAEATAEVRNLALEAYRLMRCDGLSRVDFFYEEGGRGWLLNEINTMPGFTPVSMYPQMWQATGMSYRDLIDELVRLAVVRHHRRSGFSTSH